MCTRLGATRATAGGGSREGAILIQFLLGADPGDAQTRQEAGDGAEVINV